MEELTPRLVALFKRHGAEVRSVSRLGERAWEVFYENGTSASLTFAGAKLWVHHPHGKTEALDLDASAFSFNEAKAQDRSVALCPATGKVLTLSVQPGDKVAAGQVLLKIESMKMEIEVRAPAEMLVSEVLTSLGAHVNYNQVLVRLKEAGPGT